MQKRLRDIAASALDTRNKQDWSLIHSLIQYIHSPFTDYAEENRGKVKTRHSRKSV